MTGPVVYGGSLAALVAALELAERGERLTLAMPSPRAGGHFGGASIGDASFDAGLVIFEFGTFNAESDPDVREYDPSRRNDCGRFVRVLERWVRGLGIALHRTPRFRLWHDGRRIPDFLFDTCIEGIATLPPVLRDAAATQLRTLAAGGAGRLHARRKYVEPDYADLGYGAASLANHGASLHETIMAPFCRKLTGLDPDAVLALWSRAAWLPLYWPETALRGARGDATALADAPFHVVAGGAVRHLVDVLHARLRAHPGVHIVVGPAECVAREGRRVVLHAAGERLETDALVWGESADALLQAAGVPAPEAVDRIPITIGLALVRREAVLCPDVGTTMVPSGDALPYRIANQSANAGTDEPLVRVSCEWNSAQVPGDDAAVADALRRALLETRVIDDPAAIAQTRVLRVPRALVVPSAANRDRVAAALAAVEDLALPVRLVGPSAGFGAASLNDHLVQGLQAAALLAPDQATRSAA